MTLKEEIVVVIRKIYDCFFTGSGKYKFNKTNIIKIRQLKAKIGDILILGPDQYSYTEKVDFSTFLLV